MRAIMPGQAASLTSSCRVGHCESWQRGAACALLGGAAPAGASISRAHLEHGLAKQMHRVGGGSGAWSYDLDAPNHGLLFSWASKTPRVLASNSKLFTTAAVLHRYGADAKLDTRVYPQRRSDLHRHAIRGTWSWLARVIRRSPAAPSQAQQPGRSRRWERSPSRSTRQASSA